MYKTLSFFHAVIERFVLFITRLLRPRSIRKLFTQIFALLISLFLLLFLITSFSYSAIMRDQLYDSMYETLSMHNNNLTQGFQEALTYLSENGLRNSDFSNLNTSKSDTELYLNTMRIKNNLFIGTYSLSGIGGLFVYSADKDIYIPQANETWDNILNNRHVNNHGANLIRDLLRIHKENGTLEQLNQRSWFVLSDQQDYFLVRVLKSSGNYAGAWIHLNYLTSSFESFQNMGAVVLLTDENGTCIGNPDYEGIQIDVDKHSGNSSYYYENLFRRYLTVSVRLNYSDYYICVLIPDSYIFQEQSHVYGLIFFILFWLLLLSVTLIVLMIHFFNTPSQILNPVIQSMRNGQFTSKIEPEHEFQEIREITDTFNDMIGEIQNLRIHIYEKQLTNKELELQYLKSQVAPHFLINCLNTIFILSLDNANHSTMHSIVRTLSQHLRYTLAARDHVSLHEEIYHVENYLQLTQLRFPNTLKYEFSVEETIKDARVFPLLLLMLTENSVKTGVVMGESFLVMIRGYRYEKQIRTGDGDPSADRPFRVHLTHIDSGNGFEEEYLEIYNHIIDHPEVREKGKSIGLYNTAMRLKLIYGETARIEFSNEPGYGARVDIDIPYLPCENTETPV